MTLQIKLLPEQGTQAEAVRLFPMHMHAHVHVHTYTHALTLTLLPTALNPPTHMHTHATSFLKSVLWLWKPQTGHGAQHDFLFWLSFLPFPHFHVLIVHLTPGTPCRRGHAVEPSMPLPSEPTSGGQVFHFRVLEKHESWQLPKKTRAGNLCKPRMSVHTLNSDAAHRTRGWRDRPSAFKPLAIAS